MSVDVDVAIVSGVAQAGAHRAEKALGGQGFPAPGAAPATKSARARTARLPAQKHQNGKAMLNAAIASPPIAGPIARLTL